MIYSILFHSIPLPLKVVGAQKMNLQLVIPFHIVLLSASLVELAKSIPAHSMVRMKLFFENFRGIFYRPQHMNEVRLCLLFGDLTWFFDDSKQVIIVYCHTSTFEAPKCRREDLRLQNFKNVSLKLIILRIQTLEDRLCGAHYPLLELRCFLIHSSFNPLPFCTQKGQNCLQFWPF